MKLYRIYTENTKQQWRIRELVARRFTGFTLLKGVGYWQGKREQSLIIEYIGEDSQQDAVEALAQDIRAVNHQESVLVTAQPVEVCFA